MGAQPPQMLGWPERPSRAGTSTCEECEDHAIITNVTTEITETGKG